MSVSAGDKRGGKVIAKTIVESGVEYDEVFMLC